MYLIDVQRDQVEGVRELVVEGRRAARAELIPTVRARIAAVNEKEIDLEAAGVRGERGRLGREYVVTYRPRLEFERDHCRGTVLGRDAIGRAGGLDRGGLCAGRRG